MRTSEQVHRQGDSAHTTSRRRGRARVARARGFDAHPLERRLLMAFSPAIGGDPIAVAGTPYNLSLLPTPTTYDPLTRWEINWGDGSAVQNVTPGTTVAPHTYASAGNYAAKARALLASGTYSPWAPFGLDPTFDGDGRRTFNPSGLVDRGDALAVQPDGKLVVAGESNGDFLVARFNTDGSLDDGSSTDLNDRDSFGSGGFVTLDIENGTNDIARALALQADGKIVVGGFSDPQTPPGTVSPARWTLARFNADGSLDDGGAFDTTGSDRFGTDGRVVTALANNGYAPGGVVYGLAVQPDGKIVAVGEADGPYFVHFVATRYWPGGAIDKSFGTSGEAYVDFTRGTTQSMSSARDVAIQPDGKIVLAGYACYAASPMHFDFALARLQANGQLDTGFGSSGKVLTDFGSSSSTPNSELAYSIVLQPDGKIVAGGQIEANLTNPKFGLARYNTNGLLDDGGISDITPGDSFGSGGLMWFDVGTASESIYDLAVQSDGKIVAAGVGGTGSADFAVARVSSSGILDSTWGSGGILTADVAGTSDLANGVAVLPDGDVVVAGYAGNQVALARFQPYNTVAAHTAVYSQDFPSGATVGSEWQHSTDANVGLETHDFLGWFREHSGNQDQDIWTELTVNSVPTHTKLTLSFDLYLDATWDGISESFSRWGQDHFMVSADGVNVFDTTFSVHDFQRQTYSEARHDTPIGAYAWVDKVPPSGDTTSPYQSGLYRITLTFAHSASTARIRFASNTRTSSGAWDTDEAWALDNVRLTVPTTLTFSEPVDPDLRIDADNDGVNATVANSTNPVPDFNEWHADNRAEWDWDGDGKRVTLNTDNDDAASGDTIPDFADGYNRDPADANDNLTSGENDFTKLVLDLSRINSRTTTKLRFFYDGSSPSGVTKVGTTYTPAPGRLRLWRKQGDVARTVSDYIVPGQVYSATTLGISSTVGAAELWIEAIGSTGGSKYFSDEPIHVELDPTGSGAYFNASDEVIVTARNTAASVPPPVDGVQASNAVGTTALVSWVADPLSTGATGYRVYRSTTYAFTPGGANLVHTTTDPNEASFQDTGLTPGVIYYYRVEAFNNAGESDPSIQEDTETSLQAAPIAPGALAATRSGNQVTLTWENRSGSRTIRIERSTNSSFTSSTFFTANDDFATSWLDTGAGGATFFYRVVAIEDQYNRSEARLSDPSNVVSA